MWPTHFILAFESGKGPYPDVGEFEGLIRQAAARVKLKTVLADAGYDSESNHEFAREEMALRTVIPPKHGRPTDKPAKGKYRRLMQTRFDEECYRKRSQVETVMSMIKRRQGSFCKGKTYWSRCRELHLMVLTHNIMILLPPSTFLQSQSNTVCRADLLNRAVSMAMWVRIPCFPLDVLGRMTTASLRTR